MNEPLILCIGIGNEYRTDDALGLLIAREVQSRHLPGIKCVEATGEGTALMTAWAGYETVFLIDAVLSGNRPGTLYRLPVHNHHVPTGFFHYSTHAFSVAEAIELARTLGQLPPRLIIFGIEGKNFSAGIGLSSEVRAVIPDMVKQILTDPYLLQRYESV